jgi:uncharacterized protein (TIGR03435 family)
MRRKNIPANIVLSTVFCMLAGASGRTGNAQRESPSGKTTEVQPMIEVATIKPHDPNNFYNDFSFTGGRVVLENQSVWRLIAFAWSISQHQIVDAPEWVNKSWFDIEGKANTTATPTIAEEQMMVQRILAERFVLRFHFEKRELSVYAMQVTKGGS